MSCDEVSISDLAVHGLIRFSGVSKANLSSNTVGFFSPSDSFLEAFTPKYIGRDKLKVIY